MISFLGQLNMDLRKLAVNMIPFPTLHFLMTSFSPLQTRQIIPNEHALIKQMFDINNQMLAFNPRQGKYLTATGIFRGKSLSLKILHELMAKEKNNQDFIQWIPNNVSRREMKYVYFIDLI
jgi:tubulin beta